MANCSGSVSSPTFALEEEEEEEEAGQAGEDILEDALEVSLMRPKFSFVRRYSARGGSYPGSVWLPIPCFGSGFQVFERAELGETLLFTFPWPSLTIFTVILMFFMIFVNKYRPYI